MSERQVPLTDEQYKTLYGDFQWERQMPDLLVSMIEQLMDRLTARRRQAWDAIYRLSESDPKHDHVTVDWLNRCIVVKPLEEVSDDITTS